MGRYGDYVMGVGENEMIVLKNFIARLFVHKESEDDFLSEETQIEIAKDEALNSAIQLCVIQQGVLSGLVQSLDEMGIEVGVDEELNAEIERLVSSLRASYDLAGEIVGFNEVLEKELE